MKGRQRTASARVRFCLDTYPCPMSARRIANQLNVNNLTKISRAEVQSALEILIGQGLVKNTGTNRQAEPVYVIHGAPNAPRSRRARKAPGSGVIAGPVIYRQLKWTQDTL